MSYAVPLCTREMKCRISGVRGGFERYCLMSDKHNSERRVSVLDDPANSAAAELHWRHTEVHSKGLGE